MTLSTVDLWKIRSHEEVIILRDDNSRFRGIVIGAPTEGTVYIAVVNVEEHGYNPARWHFKSEEHRLDSIVEVVTPNYRWVNLLKYGPYVRVRCPKETQLLDTIEELVVNKMEWTDDNYVDLAEMLRTAEKLGLITRREHGDLREMIAHEL